MTGLNHVILIGNLTRDPELRQIPSGTSVADLGLATNEHYRTSNGDIAETTCFVDIVTWGKQAENCNKYLRKGSPIFVEGKLQLDQWKTDDGHSRSKLRVKANRVRFLSKNSDAQKKSSADKESAITISANIEQNRNENPPF